MSAQDYLIGACREEPAPRALEVRLEEVALSCVLLPIVLVDEARELRVALCTVVKYSTVARDTPIAPPPR